MLNPTGDELAYLVWLKLPGFQEYISRDKQFDRPSPSPAISTCLSLVSFTYTRFHFSLVNDCHASEALDVAAVLRMLRDLRHGHTALTLAFGSASTWRPKTLLSLGTQAIVNGRYTQLRRHFGSYPFQLSFNDPTYASSLSFPCLL